MQRRENANGDGVYECNARDAVKERLPNGLDSWIKKIKIFKRVTQGQRCGDGRGGGDKRRPAGDGGAPGFRWDAI